MSEEREAYWVGSLAMTLAIAFRHLESGHPDGARAVIEAALRKYAESDECEPRFRRRLRREWRAKDPYSEAA